MKTFKLKIVTPRGIYKETEVELLNLRTTAGQIGILANHLPLASGLEIAEMDYKDANGKEIDLHYLVVLFMSMKMKPQLLLMQ